AGICHGAVKGQNGFKLSLFGAEPQLDHNRLVREERGRRINPVDPDNSLLLLKATGQAVHQGGKRMGVGSPEYQIIRDWIAQGARFDQSALTRLTVTPAQQTLQPGQGFALKVEAAFDDGSREEVTSLCTFESRDSTVAVVDAAGKGRAAGVGDTALVI